MTSKQETNWNAKWEGTPGFLYLSRKEIHASTLIKNTIGTFDVKGLLVPAGETLFYIGKTKISREEREFESSIFHDFIYNENIIRISLYMIGNLTEKNEQQKDHHDSKVIDSRTQ